MQRDQIIKIIDIEGIKSQIKNAHGITSDNIYEHIPEPVLEEYVFESDRSQIIMLWTILEEVPEKKNGFKIVYDSRNKEFGSAYIGRDGLKYFEGFYDNFIEALNSM